MKFQRLIFSLRSNKTLTFIVLVFAIIFGLVTFINHYFFRTFNLDLGAYSNAMYDYIHFRWNDSLAFKETPENLLADHFDVYLILFSPLTLIFKTYTLLIVQWFAILLGGIGVYKVILFKTTKQKLALFALIHFYLFFGIIAALNFDYHSNVVASMIVPWLILAVFQQKIRTATILLIFIFIGKENMALWMMFLTLGLSFDQWKIKPVRNYLLFMSLVSIVAFIGIIGFIMPAISNAGAYPHFNYSALGSNGKEALLFLTQHPFDSMYMLFTNHTHHPEGNYVKAETFVFLCLAGLPFLLKKPQYLLMLVPVVLQKMFHDNFYMWSHSAHYSIEFAPIISIGAFLVIAEIKSIKMQSVLTYVAVIFTLGATIRSLDSTIYWTNKDRLRIYSKKHYERNFDVRFVHMELTKLPQNATISAQSPFVPHISLRDKVYEFPRIGDAEYIVFHYKESPAPMNEEDFITFTDELLHSEHWNIQLQKNDLIILKRKRK